MLLALLTLRRLRHVGGGRIDLVAVARALADPIERVYVRPGDHVRRADVPLELCREFTERQLLLVDDRAVPHGVKVGRLAEPGHLHLVSAMVATTRWPDLPQARVGDGTSAMAAASAARVLIRIGFGTPQIRYGWRMPRRTR